MLLCCCVLLAVIPYKTIYRHLFGSEWLTSLNLCTSSWAYHSPLLSLSLWDPLEITIQYHFPASAAQRPVSGALVMGNYQLAQMKWPLEKTSQNISPSLSLSLSLSLPLYFALPPSQFDSLSLSFSVGSMPLKRSMKSMSRIHSFAPSAFRPACLAMVGC